MAAADARRLRRAALAGYAAMLAGLFGLLLRHSLIASSLPAILVQLAALALFVWARLAFGLRSFHPGATPTARGLVTTGPYRWVRHPIYTAACLIAWAGALSGGSLVGVALAALVTAGALVRTLCEERLVAVHHPEYADYAARTARMIPGVF